MALPPLETPSPTDDEYEPSAFWVVELCTAAAAPNTGVVVTTREEVLTVTVPLALTVSRVETAVRVLRDHDRTDTWIVLANCGAWVPLQLMRSLPHCIGRIVRPMSVGAR